MQVGLVVERLVGRLAFAVVYVASGVLAGVWSLTLHPVSVQAGAAGAIFGVYGVLLASLVLGLAQRSALTVPLNVLKGFWPGVAVFIVYNMLTEGAFSEAMQAGLVVGFTGGMLIAGRVISDKPPARRVLRRPRAAVAIVVALAAPLRGFADVSGEVARVKEVKSARRALRHRGRSVQGRRITLRNWPGLPIVSWASCSQSRRSWSSLDNVPAEHWPMVEKASEYLRLRQDSWRLRARACAPDARGRFSRPTSPNIPHWPHSKSATAPIQQ